jgi:glycosyltransferase involved in cell wall biosynthesis
METSGIKRRLLVFIEKLTYRLASKIYANSKGLSDFIVNQKMISTNKITVLGNGSSNGINTVWFNPDNILSDEITETRNELNIPISDIVFLFVGRVVRDKGINEMVEAFTKLQNEQPNCTLLLVGPYEDHLDPISNSTRMTIVTHKKIVLTGFQSDVRKYFALSDVLVFPSYREGFPNVVLQAGAMDLPSIVTNINGCNEIIEHEVNGLIIEKKNTSDLYSAMKNLYNNKELRERLSDNSRKMIVDRFEQLEFWNILLNEYRSLQK